jgi:lipopolysaccharide transport system ATP-binding protein
MNDFALRTIGLGKMYHIGAEREKYLTLRDTLAKVAMWPIERIRHPGAATHKSEILWALQDVDLEVKPGEALGIIGGNGAGKSTLLKVLSHITEPTAGRVEVYGRVGSLLEVGTGFHPELTGRENILLNGAILGMSRTEIKRKFNEIVEFSEIGRFLDTPVKRYSSGMYVRLAFAVAAHLDPEVLVVDEVLAVGDAGFQKKCLGKMEDVAGGGRTVLFVSHNMAAVNHLCARAVLLQGGQVVTTGPTEDVISRYLETRVDEAASADLASSGDRPPWAHRWLRSVRMTAADGTAGREFEMGQDVVVEAAFGAPNDERLRYPVLGIEISSSRLGTVAAVNNRMTGVASEWERAAEGTIRCRLIRPPLLPGTYSLDVWLGDGHGNVDCVRGAASFRIIEGDPYGTGVPPFATLGVFYLDASFERID